jgi:hypothetical protein
VWSAACSLRPARLCSRRDKIRPYINNDGQIKHTFSRQLVAEFLGTMLFQIFGGAAPAEGGLAAPANGFALVAISEWLAALAGDHCCNMSVICFHQPRQRRHAQLRRAWQAGT